MKLSGYDIIMPVDKGRYLLFNGLYGAVDVIPSETAEVIRAGTLEKLPSDVVRHLIQRGHLTNSPGEENEDFKLLTMIDKKIRRDTSISLTILPTYNCNFRCPYCYEKHRLMNGEEWLCRTISREMVDAIFAATRKEREKGMRISGCRLFGGEPLLKENSDIVRYICEKAREADIPLSVITNGYDLDHFIPLLKEFAFKKVQVTLDGVKEENDQRRIHKDGKGTYDVILDNVGRALENGINIRLRVNTGPKNIGTVYELRKVFGERGFLKERSKDSETRGRFEYYFKCTNYDPYPGQSYGVTDREIYKMLLEKGAKPREAMKLEGAYAEMLERAESLVDRKNYLEPRASRCSAENRMYLIDPEGVIYTCWDFVAMKDMSVGQVNVESQTLDLRLSALKWRSRTVENMPGCAGCPYVFECSGGCASRAYSSGGTVIHGTNPETAGAGDYTKPDCGETGKIFSEALLQVCRDVLQKEEACAKEKNETSKCPALSRSLRDVLSLLTAKDRNVILTSNSQREIINILKKAGGIRMNREEFFASDLYKNLSDAQKEKIEKCRTEQEIMAVIDSEKVELSMEDLDKVTGGWGLDWLGGGNNAMDCPAMD